MVTHPRENDVIRFMRAVADYTFGCRHTSLSWVFTIGRRTYKVCRTLVPSPSIHCRRCRLSVDRHPAFVRTEIRSLTAHAQELLRRLISPHEELQSAKIN
jgi:hypothetical protein